MLKEYEYLREALPKNIRFEDRVHIKTYSMFKLYEKSQIAPFNIHKAYARYMVDLDNIVEDLSKVMMYNHF